MARYAPKFPSPLLYTDRPEGTTSYVQKGENAGRYETKAPEPSGRYQAYTDAALHNPVGVEKMPTPDGWAPEWPVTFPIGPSANYRTLPDYKDFGGCGVCGGFGATTAQEVAAGAANVAAPTAGDPKTLSASPWVIPALIGAAALLLFWGTLKQGK